MPDLSADGRMAAKTSTLHELFDRPVQFAVPEYQRKYVWNEEDQWEPLWEDLQTLAERVLSGVELEQATPHFMGAIVVMPRQPDEPVGSLELLDIVDGQQRLVTLQLVLDAAHASVKRGTNVHRRLSALVTNEGHDAGGSRYAYKMWPSEEDHEAFVHAMRDELSTDAHADSSVAQAHRYFTVKIREWIDEEAGQDAKRAAALGEAIMALLQVVVIKLAATDDAQLIFETLNARGTPLGTFDLLKNFIQRTANRRGLPATTIHNQHLKRLDGQWWGGLIGSGRMRKSHIDSFLYHWLMMETGATDTSSTKVFATIRAHISETRRDDVDAVAKELGLHAEHYRQFHRIEVPPEFGDFFRRWRIMRGEAFTPLLLWLWSPDRKMSKTQRLQAVQDLESYLVRRLVCGLPTRAYGDICRDLLERLKSPRVRRSPDVVINEYLRRRKYDSERWPADREFREGFASPNKLTTRRRRMVLEAIECSFRGSHWKAKPAELAKKRGLTIEHVMPRQRDAAGYTAPEMQAHGGNPELIESFGNMTLLPSRLNSKLSTEPWVTKNDAYLNEDTNKLALNRDLVHDGGKRKLNDWTDREIRRRAARLAKRAIDIWPRGQIS